MKRLYLIRHGDAEFTGQGRGDHGRQLTSEGKNQAARLGRLLADAGIELVLSSTAERAAQTAAGMGLSAPIQQLDELYGASAPGIMRILGDLDTSEVSIVAVVAHAPGIPDLVDRLAGQDPDPQAAARISHFATATVAAIDFTGLWLELEDTHLSWADRG